MPIDVIFKIDNLYNFELIFFSCISFAVFDWFPMSIKNFQDKRKNTLILYPA